MPPSQYHRPETALTKARELIKCDKKTNALEILFDVMRVRRAKQWQKVLEDLMMLFVDLCVELRKNIHFRKAIYHYKNISIMENTSSLEQVIRYYLSSIKTRTEAAQQESESALMDVEDLDILETPESLMLNAVSLEGAQDRSARMILMPWLKFLWDSYRLVLDLLRGNAKLERLYHDIANDAYDFCLKYGRKAEFRKLSELLRLHTQKVQNQPQPNAPNAINLNNPETQVLHFETRLRQLDVAMELEMYNEAFKTVEDIWSFIFMSKKITSPVLMTNYYSKSAELFLRCGCHLYHAAALHKLMFLYRDHKKNVTREELSVIGSRVLCATLAVPLPNAKLNADKFLLSGEYAVVKQKTLANLLGLFQVPTRQSLIHDLIRHKVPSMVPAELAGLYTILEADFQPLRLWERCQPAMRFIQSSPDLAVYTSQLHEVLVSKTLLQLSQVYQTIRFEEFTKLCPFMDSIALERCIIELIHNLELPIRINHRIHAIMFDEFTDLGISQCDYGGQLVSQATHVNAPDRLSRQLTMFAQVMQQITEMLEGSQGIPEYRRVLVNEYRQNAQQFHMDLLNRRYYIEGRKEQVELMQEERDQYYMREEERRHQEQEQRLEFEEKNLQKEAEERERKKTEDEQARLKRKIARGHYNLLMENKMGVKLGLKELTEEQLDQFDADKILEKKALEVRKKRKEAAEKAKAMAKKLDYYTRAIRLEEIPLLQAAVEPEAQQAREYHERSMKEIEEHSMADHMKAMKERTRLLRMKTDVQLVVSRLKDARDARYKTKLAEWEELVDSTRTRRLAELKAKREAEEAAEAERKAREEEEARQEAEAAAKAERAKQEEKAKEAAAREEARAEEERQRMEAKRGEIAAEETAPSRLPDLGTRPIRQPGLGMNRDGMRDASPKQPDASEPRAWTRSGPKRTTAFETTPRRGPADSDTRAEQSGWGRMRGTPRKTLPPELEASTRDDDPGGEWTQVGQKKDSDRNQAPGGHFGSGGFGRGSPVDDGEISVTKPEPLTPETTGRQYGTLDGGRNMGLRRPERSSNMGENDGWTKGSALTESRGPQTRVWRGPARNPGPLPSHRN